MNGDEECEIYQTDMERILSHNLLWWQSQCRKIELDHKRCIKNREDRNAKMDKALDTIKEILAGKTPIIATGQVWLDNMCIDLKKLKEES